MMGWLRHQCLSTIMHGDIRCLYDDAGGTVGDLRAMATFIPGLARTLGGADVRRMNRHKKKSADLSRCDGRSRRDATGGVKLSQRGVTAGKK